MCTKHRRKKTEPLNLFSEFRSLFFLSAFFLSINVQTAYIYLQRYDNTITCRAAERELSRKCIERRLITHVLTKINMLMRHSCIHSDDQCRESSDWHTQLHWDWILRYLFIARSFVFIQQNACCKSVYFRIAAKFYNEPLLWNARPKASRPIHQLFPTLCVYFWLKNYD